MGSYPCRFQSNMHGLHQNYSQNVTNDSEMDQRPPVTDSAQANMASEYQNLWGELEKKKVRSYYYDVY